MEELFAFGSADPMQYGRSGLNSSFLTMQNMTHTASGEAVRAARKREMAKRGERSTMTSGYALGLDMLPRVDNARLP